MTVVVGSPYIDCLFKASYLELIAVIGDIGGKISGIAVGSDKNLVFQLKAFNLLGGFAFVCKPCAENLLVFIPECAALFIGQPLLFIISIVSFSSPSL